MPRYYVTLYAEIEAENQDEAARIGDHLCQEVTFSDEFDSAGIKRLDFDDRGDGPIIEDVPDEAEALIAEYFGPPYGEQPAS